MNNHESTIEKFYRSFQALDAAGMTSCYHPDIFFYDPVFENLDGERAKLMWSMLCANAKDFEISYSEIEADDEYGLCRWTASYTFSSTGKKVVNQVSSKFKFKDGLIVEHLDDFDLWKWSRQALGWKGLVLGWTSTMKNKIRREAKRNLIRYATKYSTRA